MWKAHWPKPPCPGPWRPRFVQVAACAGMRLRPSIAGAHHTFRDLLNQLSTDLSLNDNAGRVFHASAGSSFDPVATKREGLFEARRIDSGFVPCLQK